MHPEKESIARILGVRKKADGRVRELRARHRRIRVAAGIRWHGRHVPGVDPLRQPVLRLEIPMGCDSHRPKPDVPQALGQKRVLGKVRVEMRRIAKRLARVFADERRPQALAGVRSHRIRALEDGGSRGESVEVGRYRTIVPHEAQVDPQGIDGDENEIQPVGKDVLRRLRCGRLTVRLREIRTRAVLVDAITGDVDRVGRPAWVGIIAIASAEEKRRAVPIAVGRATRESQSEMAERGSKLDGTGNLRIGRKRVRLLDDERHGERDTHGGANEPAPLLIAGRAFAESRPHGDRPHRQNRGEIELAARQHAKDGEGRDAVATRIPEAYAGDEREARPRKTPQRPATRGSTRARSHGATYDVIATKAQHANTRARTLVAPISAPAAVAGTSRSSARLASWAQASIHARVATGATRAADAHIARRSGSS